MTTKEHDQTIDVGQSRRMVAELIAIFASVGVLSFNPEIGLAGMIIASVMLGRECYLDKKKRQKS